MTSEGDWFCKETKAQLCTYVSNHAKL
uniref:Uncharacterized protein n=1 Tax=Anguilla anguilla TaxID=7936 RepID=A0A0E9TAS8_ANGAN